MDRSRSSDDKVFQAAGPDVENARGPNVDVSVLGTTSWYSWYYISVSLPSWLCTAVWAPGHA